MPPSPSNSQRRNFLKKAATVILAALSGLIPAGAGLAVLLDPLRRKSQSGAPIRVAGLEALPQDGTPQRFNVIASRTDAWNKFPRVPVGAVYLRRTGPRKVEALNVICPHAGCYVDFLPEQNSFICPCHNSLFSVEGKITEPGSPAPRNLDTLECFVRGKDVWVKFQKFRTGVAEKIAEA